MQQKIDNQEKDFNDQLEDQKKKHEKAILEV